VNKAKELRYPVVSTMRNISAVFGIFHDLDEQSSASSTT
jgi:hypothetical protein